MEYREILKDLAPCGLSCRKCFANTDGYIPQTSRDLMKYLGAFDIYAERFSNFEPKFKNYPVFKEMLEHFAKGGCGGCRNETCGLWPDCAVAACYKEKSVDFCFQCDEFPCEKVNFDEHLRRRWVAMNERMKEAGVETYYEETKDEPRYK